MFAVELALIALACGALGYLLGRRQDRLDIHRAPVDFEPAIQRIIEPEPILHHPKVKRAAKRKPARRRGRL